VADFFRAELTLYPIYIRTDLLVLCQEVKFSLKVLIAKGDGDSLSVFEAGESGSLSLCGLELKKTGGRCFCLSWSTSGPQTSLKAALKKVA
jgi:hypothetical protein